MALDKHQPVPPSPREFNCKLCVLLTPAIPESIKQRVLEDADDAIHMSAVEIMDEHNKLASDISTEMKKMQEQELEKKQNELDDAKKVLNNNKRKKRNQNVRLRGKLKPTISGILAANTPILWAQ